MSVEFVVFGKPVPKGRPRFGANGHVHTPQATKDAERTIAEKYRYVERGKMHHGPLAVDLYFRVKGKRRGDLDNYIKTVLDALNTVAWEDDHQIVRLTAEIESGYFIEGYTRITIDELTRPADGLPKEAPRER